MAVKAAHVGYHKLLTRWEQKTELIDVSLEELQTQAASAKVYHLLAQTEMIKGVEKQNGADAWRLMVARFNAKTFGKESA